MTAKQIQQLKINALALRKIADTVLQQVEAVEKDAAPAKPIKRKSVKVDRLASLKARILTGNRKPNSTVKSKKG